MVLFDKLNFKKNKNNVIESNQVKLESLMNEYRYTLYTTLGKELLVQMNKYGSEITKQVFSQYLIDGNVRSFTKDNNCRENLMNLDRETIYYTLTILYSNKMDLSDIYNEFIDDVILNAKNILDDSLISNVEKYGLFALESGINKIKLNEFNGITSNNNSRNNIIEYGINSTTINFIMLATKEDHNQTKLPLPNREKEGYMTRYIEDLTINKINNKKLSK